jgi:hypothetical protein
MMTSPNLEPDDIAKALGLTRNAYAVRVHRVRRRIDELSRDYDAPGKEVRHEQKRGA